MRQEQETLLQRLEHADTLILEQTLEKLTFPAANPAANLPTLGAIYQRSLLLGFQRGLSGSLAETGAVYYTSGQPGKAADYILRSLQLPAFNEYVSGNAQNNLACIYMDQGAYEDAFLMFQKAIKSPDRNVASYALHNMIGLLIKLKRPKEAHQYLKQQMKQATEWNQPKVLVAALATEAMLYAEDGQFRLSDSVSKVGLELSTRHHYKDQYTAILFNSSKSYVRRGKKEQGMKILQDVMSQLPAMDTAMQLQLYAEYGMVLLGSGRPGEAIFHLQNSISLAGQTGVRDILSTLFSLAEAYRISGRYEMASQTYRRYSLLKDSLDSSAEIKKFNELEVKYRTASKDRDLMAGKLSLLHKDALIQEKNRAIYLTLGLGSLVTLTVLLLWKRSVSRREREQIALLHRTETERLKAAIAGEERERRRIGRDLHDNIGSLLTALHMDISASHARNLTEYGINNLERPLLTLRKVIHEARSSSHNLMPDYLLIEGLLPGLQSLVTQLSTDRLPITIELEGIWKELPQDTNLGIYRVIQELLNNVIKHSNATTATVHLNAHADKLLVSVRDNGDGFQQGRPATGIGLLQIESRVAAMGGTLDIQSRERKGTCVIINLSRTAIDGRQ